MKQKHVFLQEGLITKSDRQRLNGHKSCVVWFTGLSGSGKSTLSVSLEQTLHHLNVRTYRLDGDNMRQRLNQDLGFSKRDREENIRRVGEVSKLFIDAGIITLAAFISPYKKDRDRIRSLLNEGEFIEVYVKCDVKECEKRDPKGLYQKARNGEISGFTGIDDPYEEPENPEIVVKTDQMTVEQCTEKILKYLKEKGYLTVRSM